MVAQIGIIDLLGFLGGRIACWACSLFFGMALAMRFLANEMNHDDPAPAASGENGENSEGFEANDASARGDLLDLMDNDWDVVPGTATGSVQSIYRGGPGPDTLVGEDGNDRFRDPEGDAVMVGKGGNDCFVVGPGTAISGGDKSDSFDLRLDTEEEHIVIGDFAKGEDMIDRIILDTAAENGDGLTKEVWADGVCANLYHADTLIASIVGGQGSVPDAIPLWSNVNGAPFTGRADDRLIRASGADQMIGGGAGADTFGI